MCRIAAYRGPPIALGAVVIEPEHSLREQSYAATEAEVRTHGDGFGVAWYGRGAEPGCYRDMLPAWSDGNLPDLCRMVESSLFLAHVRAASDGGSAMVDCHPFVFGRWSFIHNGQIPHIKLRRRVLEPMLSDELYLARKGTTDSEFVFLLMLQNGLDDDPAAALARTLAQIEGLREAGDDPTVLTIVFGDGERLYAYRYASDDDSPEVYVSSFGEGTALASEPLDGSDGWSAIEADRLVTLSAEGMTSRALPEG